MPTAPDNPDRTNPATLRAAFADFRKAWLDLLVFDVLFKIIAFVVLSPAVGWLFQRFIASSGTEAVGNFDIVAFLLTPLELTLFLVITSLFATVLAMEAAGLMLIGLAASRGERLTTLDVLPRIFTKIGPIAGVCLAGLGILAACLAPFVGVIVAIAAWFLGAHDVNYYLEVRPPEFQWAVGLGATVGILAGICVLFVVVRLLFAIPNVLLCECGVGKALSESWRLTRGRSLSIAGKIFAVALIWAVAYAAANQGLLLVGGLLVSLAGTHLTLLLTVLGIMTAVGLVAGALLGFAGFAYGCLVVVRLFEDACERFERPITLSNAAEAARRGDAAARWALSRKGLVLASLGLLVLGTLVTIGLIESVQWEDNVDVTAHRGSSAAAPENTLAAIRRAIDDGADYAEIDVQLTSDGVVVVAHDADMMRIGKSPAVIRKTPYAELAKIDVGSRFSSEFAGESIPTLDEVIDAAKGRIKLIVELKCYDKKPAPLAAAVVEKFRKRDLYSQAVVMSLHYADLKEVRRLDKRIVRGFIASASLGNLSRLDVDFVAVSKGKATGSLIASMHAVDKEVFVWTVDKRKTMSLMIDRGVDNIITNRPAQLVELLHERAELGNVERILLRFRGLYL